MLWLTLAISGLCVCECEYINVQSCRLLLTELNVALIEISLDLSKSKEIFWFRLNAHQAECGMNVINVCWSGPVHIGSLV